MTPAQTATKSIATRAAPKEVARRAANRHRRLITKMGKNIVKVCLAVLGIVCLVASAGSAPQTAAVKPDPVPPVAAVSPFIDVHVHLEKPVADESIQVAVHAMGTGNIAKYLFLPSPFDEAGPASFDIEFIKETIKQYSEKISVSGGGGTLNP